MDINADFTKPGFYKTRHGEKAEVLAVRNGKLIGVDHRGDVSDWLIDGTWWEGEISVFDLVSPWDEPKGEAHG